MAPNIDLAALSNEDLDAHCLAVSEEQQRRQRLAQTPAYLASLVARYAEDGGDPAELLASVPDTTSA